MCAPSSQIVLRISRIGCLHLKKRSKAPILAQDRLLSTLADALFLGEQTEKQVSLSKVQAHQTLLKNAS